MTNFTYPIRIPALKVLQPLGEFYVAVLPAEILLNITYSDPLKIIGSSESGGYELKGHQRKLVQERLKAIGMYIDTVEAAFPNSIILAANYREDGQLEEDDELRWKIDVPDNNQDICMLTIPSSAKLAAIVDGQHRLYGFKHSLLKDRISMPLLTAIYIDLPNPFQAYLFATINYNQKPVDKSQSYEQYGYNLEEEPPDAWSPEKTAVFLCRKLNTSETSPLKGHIIVAAQNDNTIEGTAKLRNLDWAVSTATIVEGLLRLFSGSPKRDRNIMHRKELGGGRSRELLTDLSIQDKSPLRLQYIEGNDLLIFTLTKNYLNAVSNILWKDSVNSIIRKTVGIQAIFDILRLICNEAKQAKDISQQFFSVKMAPCKDIDFSNTFFEASGRGRQRIRTAIELKLGLKTLANIDEEDAIVYKEVRAVL